MLLINDEFLSHIVEKVKSGEMDRQSNWKRKRQPPNRFIDESARTFTPKSPKPTKKKQKAT